MYRLLIADDEEAIRNGIAENIPWQEWGFEVCGLCENGNQVMECVDTCMPDVILSDIRMPGMDGVELMQRLNREYPHIKILILSGYSDFEYLNMSIKNHVTEYLLKPTDIDEFEQTFRKLRQSMDEERVRKAEIDQSVNIHFHNWLSDLCEGVAVNEDTERFLPVLEQKGILLENIWVLVYVLDEITDAAEARTRYQMVREIRQRMKNEVQEDQDLPCGYAFCHKNGVVTELVAGAGEEEIEKILESVRLFQEYVHKKMSMTISAGISELCEDVEILPQAYEQALCCARQNIFSGKACLYRYQELAERKTEADNYFQVEVIEKAVLAQKDEVIRSEISRVMERFDSPMLDYRSVDRKCMLLLYQLSLWGVQYGLSMDRAMKEEKAAYTDIYEQYTLEKKREFVETLILKLVGQMAEKHNQNYQGSRVAKKIQDFVDAQFCCNTLSLESVADYAQKTPAYISRLFKKELHCNFSDYLTEKRIAYAKELLRGTDQKIYEIAEKCGYVDSSNFIRVFRRVCGISPAEYRAVRGG